MVVLETDWDRILDATRNGLSVTDFDDMFDATPSDGALGTAYARTSFVFCFILLLFFNFYVTRMLLIIILFHCFIPLRFYMLLFLYFSIICM